MTRALKDMILQALEDVGGEHYLVEQAHKNPAAFMTLLGKVLPMTIAGDAAEPAISLRVVSYADVYTGVPRSNELDPVVDDQGAPLGRPAWKLGC
jgi:hypothetical protein